MIYFSAFSPSQYNLNVPLAVIRKLTKPNQTPFNRHLAARAEVLKLTAAAVLEAGAQVVALVNALTATVMHMVNQTSPKVTLLHTNEHLTNVLKLALAIITGLAVGVVNPEWAAVPYQELSLVPTPNIGLSNVVNMIFSKAYGFIGRHEY